MTGYVYSAKNNCFIEAARIEEYEAFGWDLSDVKPVSDDVFLTFTQDRTTEGVQRAAGSDGLPCWEPLPPLTKGEMQENAEIEKQKRIFEANDYMNSKQWLGKAVLGRLKDTEKVQYNAWLDYLDVLEGIDTSNPINLVWPTEPAK
ncbi:tail fiber assembly protein [Escherichia coli]|uniref:tail fiber assembly protein n=1 Tax=Escherichia coli TaxID=562 RepID=UPI00085504F8|nr:tail fiber assembly protein [Escherichia coli]EEW1880036.1 tail fiber assembly protein [Escherichia coli]EEW2161035.1 tail fiber assembly protein [Escherichia coli]EFB2277865.1 tail fiber assembly protein [Escherichia coli]EFB2330693.1 tail fiber assembly protein [Escherichia coli]EFE1259210.1 tail fiber assembly protein [Escherichia coli]